MSQYKFPLHNNKTKCNNVITVNQMTDECRKCNVFVMAHIAPVKTSKDVENSMGTDEALSSLSNIKLTE